MGQSFTELTRFNELVVIETNNPPRNIPLSTSGGDPTNAQNGRFYVWRQNPAFPQPVQTAVVPLPDNPLFNELVVIESVGTPRGIVLSTSADTPVAHCGNTLFVWRAPGVPATQAVGVAAMATGMALAAVAELKRRQTEGGEALEPDGAEDDRAKNGPGDDLRSVGGA